LTQGIQHIFFFGGLDQFVIQDFSGAAVLPTNASRLVVTTALGTNPR